MPRVTFFFGVPNRVHTAAEWLGRRRFGDSPVLVLTPVGEVADSLDHLLWTQNALGFTPHCQAQSPLAAETPIVLTSRPGIDPVRACLLNLSNQLPEQHAQCEEVVEIVSTDDNERAAARERFRAYRNLGYPIESIDLTGRALP